MYNLSRQTSLYKWSVPEKPFAKCKFVVQTDYCMGSMEFGCRTLIHLFFFYSKVSFCILSLSK